MKIRHRTRPIGSTRAAPQTVRQALHSGQIRSHTRTNRMVLRWWSLHVLLWLLLRSLPRYARLLLLQLQLVVVMVVEVLVVGHLVRGMRMRVLLPRLAAVLMVIVVVV